MLHLETNWANSANQDQGLQAVVLLWLFVDCFWCQGFGNVSPYVCHIIFSSVWVDEWPPFGKELLTWLTICSLCILTICNRGIKHDFPSINIHKVPRKVLKTECEARGFQPSRETLQILMNDKIMFDCAIIT